MEALTPLFLCLTFLVGTNLAADDHLKKIDSSILNSEGPVNVLISFNNNQELSSVLDDISTHNRGEKAFLLKEKLSMSRKENKQSLQAELQQIQSKFKKSQSLDVEIKSFWITSKMWMGGADSQTLQELAKDPRITRIETEPLMSIPTPIVADPAGNVETFQNSQWNIAMTGVSSLWARGNRGQGVIVGHIDTGVRHTHLALRETWMGLPSGWLNPYNQTSTPFESDRTNSHGTHTLGTTLGSLGYGIAPLANWTSCMGCHESACATVALLECMEFMVCPEIKDSRCINVPRVVSNSWGGTGGRAIYDEALDVWHAVGIIPVFAAGNAGPYCVSLNTPGDSDKVISVGATDQNDTSAWFTSLGPSGMTTVVKPDIVAPGVFITSAFSASDTAFGTISGTSMATPHITGAIALILSDHPEYGFKEVMNVLGEQAKKTGLTPYLPWACGRKEDDEFPNYKFGYGRLWLNATECNDCDSSSSNKLYQMSVFNALFIAFVALRL